MAAGIPRDLFKHCALRRLDPNLREVVGFSAFVSLYKFSPNENQWKKCDVEGTLFVYARSGQPSHQILVLNRRSPENYIEPITAQLILQRREPFLFYVTPACSLYGIWFHDRADCLRVSYTIEGIRRQLATPVTDEDWSDIAAFKALMGMDDSPRNSGRNASRARRSGNSNGKMPAQSRKSEGGKTRMAAQLSRTRDGNPGTSSLVKKSDDEEEEGAAAAGVAEDTIDDDEDQTPKSVVDFFARAGCAPINAQVGLVPGMTHMYGDDSEGAVMNPIVHQIVTNPYHSLEHVEKQQMMASSQHPRAAGSQRMKTPCTQRPKTAKTQKPKIGSTQKPKEDTSQKPKEGEKTSKVDPPGSLVEFLNRLKISRSTNQGSEGRIEEIPDLLPLIPEPPIPSLDSVPRHFQPIPFLPGHIGPIETFQFIPGPIDAFGFLPAGSPLSSFPSRDLGFVRPIPPEPPAFEPGAPAELQPRPVISAELSHTPEPLTVSSPTTEPHAELSQTPELPAPSSPTSEPLTALSPTPEPLTALSPTPEPLTALSPTPEPLTALSPIPDPLTALSPTPEPLAAKSQTPEPSTALSQTPEPPLPLSPTQKPPLPLSSILRQARESLPPKPELPRPEFPKLELPKPEFPKLELPKPEFPKPELPKPEFPKPELPKPEFPKLELPKPDFPKPTLPKPSPVLLKPAEAQSSSMPPAMFVSTDPKIAVQDHDYMGEVAAPSDNAVEDVVNGIDQINFDNSEPDGESATTAPYPPLHAQNHDLNVETLTRDQLLQAIHYLLQNDPSFIDKIHEAYLKSLTEKFP